MFYKLKNLLTKKLVYNDGLQPDSFEIRRYKVTIPFKGLPKDFPKRQRSFNWLCENLDKDALVKIFKTEPEWLEFIKGSVKPRHL